MTAYTEKKRLNAHDIAKSRSRKNSIYSELVSQAKALLSLAERSSGRPNKDNAKFCSQIRALIEKWDR